MNITIKPWNPGDGGLICLPLQYTIRKQAPRLAPRHMPELRPGVLGARACASSKGSGSRWSLYRVRSQSRKHTGRR